MFREPRKNLVGNFSTRVTCKLEQSQVCKFRGKFCASEELYRFAVHVFGVSTKVAIVGASLSSIQRNRRLNNSFRKHCGSYSANVLVIF